MRERGLGDRDLERLTGLPQSTFWRARTGESSPVLKTRGVIAHLLGLKLDQVLYPADRPLLPQPFPIAIHPIVRDTLAFDHRLLVAERAWYRLTPEVHREWRNYVEKLHEGDYAHARDFCFEDLERFIAEHTQSGVGTP